ncbi:hypothetical protein [Desertibaculum subflavum]|uniref:hypothetical protein n=1 Tax=Desertibaculum subflavum TaxID=2268458 RepID=UPI0013C41E63
MQDPDLEEFAAVLIQQIRDAAVRNCDGLLQPDARSPAAMRWRHCVEEPAAIAGVIPDAVDEVLFQFLNAIDQGLLRLKFVSKSGREIDLATDGGSELSGWYMGSGGWRARYSAERFNDDFADLA